MSIKPFVLSDDIRTRMEAIWNNDFEGRFGIFLTGPKDPAIWNQSFLEKPDDPAKLEGFYTSPDEMNKRMLYEVENRYYLGDAFPCLFPSFGTAGHAKYFPVDLVFKKDTIWFFPKISSLGETPLKFDPDNNAMFLRECAQLKRLAELANGRYAVAPPDNCGSIDMLAELVPPADLMLDMLYEPEMVLGRIHEAVDTLIRSGDRIFDIVMPTCNGTSQGWMHMWSPKKMMQLQCDMSVMISPQMFEKFVMPELEETVAWLDHSIYHLDGQEQIRHLDMLLSIKKLNMIQWQPVTGQPPITHFIPELRKIQKTGKGLVLRCLPSEVETLVSELSPKGVMLVCMDEQLKRTDAEALLKIVENATGTASAIY